MLIKAKQNHCVLGFLLESNVVYYPISPLGCDLRNKNSFMLKVKDERSTAYNKHDNTSYKGTYLSGQNCTPEDTIIGLKK